MQKKMKHFLIAIACALVVSLGAYYDIFLRTDSILADSFYQHTEVLDGRIMVLGIDGAALDELGKFETWDRGIMADVIEALNANPEARPQAIGVDVMFFSPTEEVYDQRLVEAASQYDNVVVGSYVNFKNGIVENADGSFSVNALTVDTYGEPYEALKQVTKQGYVNTMTDEDGIIRSNMLFVELPDGRVVNSFAYEIYKMYAKDNDLPLEVTPPMNEKNQWYIPFSDIPGGYSDNYSVLDVLTGDLSGEFFADSIVLIGPYTVGMQDAYLTAMDHTVPMHGVEIHANIVQALMDQRFKVHIPALYQSLFFFVVMFLAYFAFKDWRPKMATVLMVVMVLGYLVGIYFLGQYCYMMKVLYLPLGLGALYLTWLFVHYINEILDKKRITDVFKKYVAPQVVDELIKSGQDIQLGGIKREMACMFVDIRGFTPMSEVLEPEEVVEMLNTYLDLTCKAIFKHNGTLDKFIGDATMAIFNAPLDLDDYIYRAVLTAWDIVQGGEALGKELKEKYGRTVSFGIGLNCGQAVVGNIGNTVRMDYTAIGDMVNTAARLESQAKGGQVLLSQAVYEAVKDRIQAVYLGEIPLKGKANTLPVYGLAHINEYMDSQAALTTASLPPGKEAISYGTESKSEKN